MAYALILANTLAEVTPVHMVIAKEQFQVQVHVLLMTSEWHSSAVQSM